MVPSGSHSITAPVVLAGALSIQPTAGMTLNIPGNISEMTLGGGSLSLDGPGTLILGGSDSYTGGTTRDGRHADRDLQHFAGLGNELDRRRRQHVHLRSLGGRRPRGRRRRPLGGLARGPSSRGARTGHPGPLGRGTDRGRRHHLEETEKSELSAQYSVMRVGWAERSESHHP